MTERSATHATFVIERNFKAPPARVFNAFADRAAKALWFEGPAEWEKTRKEFDFRVGGRERLSGGPKGGTVHSFEALYQDIVPNERIIYTYDMHLDERRISVSLATVEFKPAGAGTLLSITEQGAFLDGYDDAGSREQGTRWLLDKLEASLSPRGRHRLNATPPGGSEMAYVDGFVVPVPKKQLQAYRRMAQKAGKVWREHGALEFRECIADDVKVGKWTSFPRSVKLKPNETVVFSWITYKSRAHRDRVNAKVMKDKRLAHMMDLKALPFDAKRMIYGGFKVLVEA